jgi:hypothetical protein
VRQHVNDKHVTDEENGHGLGHGYAFGLGDVLHAHVSRPCFTEEEFELDEAKHHAEDDADGYRHVVERDDGFHVLLLRVGFGYPAVYR